MNGSVRLSVCLSVRHTFFTMFPLSYHHEIFRSYHQWQKWCPCKRSRSKVKVTEVITQFSRFRTITPVWIHIWWWNDAQSLTHWGRVTHICLSKLTIIDSDNGLSPERRQAIIWTNAGILLIGPLWTNFSEILIQILTFSFKKMRLKVSFAKWRPFCLGLNVLMWLKRSALMFFKVIRQISRSFG